MAVDKDITLELQMEQYSSGDAIDATDLQNIMERLNAQYERIHDAAAPGAAGRTVRGHDHTTVGRGILRGNIGAAQIMGPPLATTIASSLIVSIAADAAYSNDYQLSSIPRNRIVGVSYVSKGQQSFRVEVAAMVTSLSYGNPQIRIKNLTDTTGPADEQIVASPWVSLNQVAANLVHWYGALAAEKLTVPVIYSTSLKRVEWDIEARIENPTGDNVEISIYQAFPYEFEAERAIVTS